VAQKPKPRPTTSASPVVYDKPATERKPPGASAPNTSSIEKWTKGDEFEEDPYAAEYLRRQDEEKRKAREASRRWKKKKKNYREAERIVEFDDIYDPAYPIRLDAYKGSEEQANADYEWKQLLHAHQFRKLAKSVASSDDEHRTSVPKSKFYSHLLQTLELTFTQWLSRRLQITTLRRHLSVRTHLPLP